MTNRVIFNPLEGKETTTQIEKEVYGAGELNRALRAKEASKAIPKYLESKAILPPMDFPSDCKIDRVGQVAANMGIAPEDRIERSLEMLREERAILENPNANLEPDERSFLLQVNQLVAEMLHLLSQLSDRDRTKTDFSKKEYNVFNGKVADSTREQGNWGFGVALGAFFVSAGTAALGDFWSKVGSALAAQSQPFSNWMTSGLAADSGKYSNKMNLISTDLQTMSSKGSDNSAWKNELIQALGEAKECLKAAVRSNG